MIKPRTYHSYTYTWYKGWSSWNKHVIHSAKCGMVSLDRQVICGKKKLGLHITNSGETPRGFGKALIPQLQLWHFHWLSPHSPWATCIHWFLSRRNADVTVQILHCQGDVKKCNAVRNCRACYSVGRGCSPWHLQHNWAPLCTGCPESWPPTYNLYKNKTLKNNMFIEDLLPYRYIISALHKVSVNSVVSHKFARLSIYDRM
jgi:hypothetical protein